MPESHQIPDAIITLVKSFENYLPAYKRGQYSEMQLRQEFIDPFFKALGWDLDNTKRYSELYKEVIHEDPIRIRGSTEFIDYSFRIGGVRKFIVEAKKPAVNIRDDAGPALQIRRYAWNAHLALSILTDFEEFAVYDCTKKPMPGDTAATARIAIFNYKEYPEKWEWIASIFSQDSILQGSFDRFAESTKGKKGTATVDEAILADIEEWRDALAKNMALRNPELTVDELNTAVQRTIDRILFLRICEDRGIEQYGCLQKLLDGPEVYPRLLGLFHRADTRYNSGIFHFTAEAGWDELPDSLTPCLIVDDAVLKKIIKRLYYPESPYEFSVISPVILGQVYEQFLGKVIRLTSGHQARIEYKPEVKKAGGVYYTPQYIVDYIVKQTVGELLKDKTPRDAAKLRILDPACGSGSFLIGAYQYLLDWHLEYYIHKLVPVLADKSVTSPEVLALLPEPLPKSGKKKSAGDVNLPIYRSANARNSRTRSDWKLTTAERKRILLNNIYGVDIDTQAVEVTKLSLLLKVLEEENEENVSKQLKLFDERALPSLHQNIKCGNSLIGTDIYADVQVTLDDPEVVKRINAFDWGREFAEIIKKGGFDAVIGNPPYLRIQGLQEHYEEQIPYLVEKFQSAVKRFDLYLLFIEKGYSLLNSKGLLGFICPHKFLNSDFGSGLREFFITNLAIKSIVSFGNNLIFKTATTYTGIFLLNRSKQSKFLYFEFPLLTSIEIPEKLSGLQIEDFSEYSINNFSSKPWTLSSSHSQDFINKISSLNPLKIADAFTEIMVGVQSGIDNIHLLKVCNSTSSNEDTLQLFSERAGTIVEIEKGLVKPILMGEDVHRYQKVLNHNYVIYPYKLIERKTVILEENELKILFPKGYSYLKNYQSELKEIRTRQKTNPKYWYSCHRSKDMFLFEQERIITPEISLGCNMTISPAGIYHNTKVYSIVANEKYSEHKFYWLGILNSPLLWWFIKTTGYALRGGYFTFKTNYLKPFPIRTINFSDPTDKARHDKMVALVERMLALHKQKADVKTDHEKNLIERQIEATDKQIDALVYELYGLTDDEIQMVEGNSTIAESNRASNDDS